MTSGRSSSPPQTKEQRTKTSERSVKAALDQSKLPMLSPGASSSSTASSTYLSSSTSSLHSSNTYTVDGHSSTSGVSSSPSSSASSTTSSFASSDDDSASSQPSTPPNEPSSYGNHTKPLQPTTSAPPPSGVIDSGGDDESKYMVIKQILKAQDLYAVLDTTSRADANTLRRAYMKRCKACHPDKYPSYPAATLAFQKVSFAYDTLAKPSTRRQYDLGGLSSIFTSADDANAFNFSHPSHTARADETLSGVLLGVFCDFMEGDFQMLRTFLRALQDLNPSLHISTSTVESLIGVFTRLRDVLLTTRGYVRLLHVELLRLAEIQSDLSKLGWLQISARMRLSIRMIRCALELPVVVDEAMSRRWAHEAEMQQRTQGLGPAPLETEEEEHTETDIQREDGPAEPAGKQEKGKQKGATGQRTVHTAQQDLSSSIPDSFTDEYDRGPARSQREVSATPEEDSPRKSSTNRTDPASPNSSGSFSKALPRQPQPPHIPTLTNPLRHRRATSTFATDSNHDRTHPSGGPFPAQHPSTHSSATFRRATSTRDPNTHHFDDDNLRPPNSSRSSRQRCVHRHQRHRTTSAPSAVHTKNDDSLDDTVRDVPQPGLIPPTLSRALKGVCGVLEYGESVF